MTLTLTEPEEIESVPRVKYYECHITLDPVDPNDDAKMAHLRDTAARYGFRVAKLLMVKERVPNPEDSFMTARNTTYLGMKRYMDLQHQELEAEGFNVRRKKIEAVVYDERF